jgi:ribulose-5-phosphate 4-epimerase/fuculose-1-phosphate aldolase
MTSVALLNRRHNLETERADLAACFRWTARLGLHEAVSNHFSLAVNEDGTEFLMNPNQVHFSLVRASDLLLLDANDRDTMQRPDAPDPTAWGLHGAIHRRLPHARCAMHVHSIHATVLACLADPLLPPLDQNAAMFFGRQAVDSAYGGLAFEEEGERVCALLADPSKCVLIMGNHGIMVIGRTVAEAFTRLYFFERAAEVYVKALMTGRPLRMLPDAVAARVAREIEDYPGQCGKHLAAIHAVLTRDGEDYRV